MCDGFTPIAFTCVTRGAGVDGAPATDFAAAELAYGRRWCVLHRRKGAGAVARRRGGATSSAVPGHGAGTVGSLSAMYEQVARSVAGSTARRGRRCGRSAEFDLVGRPGGPLGLRAVPDARRAVSTHSAYYRYRSGHPGTASGRFQTTRQVGACLRARLGSGLGTHTSAEKAFTRR